MNCFHTTMNARVVHSPNSMVLAPVEQQSTLPPSLVDWLSPTAAMEQHVYVVGTPSTLTFPQSSSTSSSSNAPLDVYFAAVHSHTAVPKRYLDDESWSTVAMTPTAVVSPQASSHKRSRPNHYQPPRQVPPSVTSAMGSLVGGSMQQSNVSVQLRRQLSGSRLDQYIGNHDRMEEDNTVGTASLRPRSMSF